jgi:CRISPR-associated protein Csm5
MELVTLTPVMVTAGRDAVLSPYTDYVHEDGFFYYLDPRKMERALAAAGASVLDEFVRGVRTGMDNTRSTFDLRRFIKTRLNRSPADLALRRVPLPKLIGQVQVRRHVADAGRPFIPGSTLKGAIRAAIFLDWLHSEEDGKAFVGDLKKKVDALWVEHKDALEKAEECFRQNQREQGRSISSPIHAKVRDALRGFRPGRLFGEMDEKDDRRRPLPNDMRLLRISDTSLLEPDRVCVESVGRVKVKDASLVSPQWAEVIPTGVALTFTLTIEPRFAKPGLRFLNDPSPSRLFELLRNFASRSLEWEIDVLDSLDDIARLDDVYNVLEDLEASETPVDAAMIRMGSGKTYFDNSLGFALQSEQDETFERFRRLLGLGRNPTHGGFSSVRFPATRSYVRDGERCVMPLGWARIQVREADRARAA